MSESSEQGTPSVNRNKRGQETGGFNFIKNLTVDVMAPSRLPTEGKLGYKSETSFFGSKLRVDNSGQMYLDFSGVMPAVDRTGDRFSRITDDHVMKDPVALMKRHPKLFVEHLIKGPKRYRGHISEIWANVQRLGLTDHYGAYHDKNGNLIGVSFKDNFIDHGRTIRNMYRAKRGLLEGEGSKEFNDVDRFATLEAAIHYIKTIHDEHGGIGEVNADDVIFTGMENGKLTQPVFSVPDIVYPNSVPNIEALQLRKNTLEIQHANSIAAGDTTGALEVQNEINEIYKAINELNNTSGVSRERKATDLIDFLMDVIEEESHMDGGQSVRKAAETIINAYEDSDIISVVESFIKRGRFTLAGDKLVLAEPEENAQIPNLNDTITTRKRELVSVHNQTRVRIAPKNAVPIKKMIVDVCESFKVAHNKQLPSTS